MRNHAGCLDSWQLSFPPARRQTQRARAGGHKRGADKQAQNASLADREALRMVTPSLFGGSAMHLVSISGSPSRQSRSSWLLQHALKRAGVRIEHHDAIAVRELPAQALIDGDVSDTRIARAHRALARAQGVLIATPIYKAAYSGLLKVFLDALPSDALRGKPVLALATGGSPGHLLAIDYALKPVLSALGARHIVDAVFAVDSQLPQDQRSGFRADAALLERLDLALDALLQRPAPPRRRSSAPLESSTAPLIVARSDCAAAGILQSSSANITRRDTLVRPFICTSKGVSMRAPYLSR
jgi:FMN reductase